MKDTRLLQIFQSVKDTICKYDYYIHTSKKIIHLSNTEDKIPHLMGLQYAGRPKQYTGDFGAYAVKKGRITMQSLEKLVQKYYRTEEKQRRILEVIHLKLDNLSFLPEMFASYSNYRGLEHCYEINRIVREDKMTKRAETIYLSSMAECRERTGIEKMLQAGGIGADEKLVTEIVKVNLKLGRYHTMDMLNDGAGLLAKCVDKREKALVSDFLALWEEKRNGI